MDRTSGCLFSYNLLEFVLFPLPLVFMYMQSSLYYLSGCAQDLVNSDKQQELNCKLLNIEFCGSQLEVLNTEPQTSNVFDNITQSSHFNTGISALRPYMTTCIGPSIVISVNCWVCSLVA